MATTKSYLVYQNDKLSYEISKEGYETITDTAVITSAETITETMVKLYTLTINPTPSDATVVLTATGYTQVGNSITVPDGTVVSYEVSKQDYQTESGSKTVTADETLEIELVQGTPIDVSDYEYTLEDKTVTLTKYVGAGGDVVIPNV